MGYYVILDNGVCVQADDVSDDRTEVYMGAAGIEAGAIVRGADGQWRYDKALRDCFGIDGDPVFETRYQAGQSIEDHCIPLPQLHKVILHHTRSRKRH